MRNKWSFGKELDDFLGEFDVLRDKDDYGNFDKFKIFCKDGKEFEPKDVSYGLQTLLLSPYQYYTQVYKSLSNEIFKAYCKTLPLMDRKMREIYGK